MMSTATAHEPTMSSSDRVINNLPALKQALLPRGHTFKGRYVLGSLINHNSGFGQLWRGTDQLTKRDVIVKLEITSPPSVLPVVLPLEAKVLLECADSAFMLPLLADGELHVRKSTGPLTVGYIVMPQAGPDLGELQRHMPAQYFTLGTAFRLVIQEIKAVQELHRRGWLHRDIKPGNFVLDNQTGNDPRDMHIFIIDFGMCGRWMTNGKHRPEREKAGFYGSPRFASLSSHCQYDLSRRDDMWSVLYTALSHVRHLPWSALHRDKVTEYAALDTIYKKLLPLEFCEEPDYAGFVAALQCDLGHAGICDDSALDWQY